MKFEIPQTDYVAHPQGMHTGVIVDVADHGERESTFEGRTRTVHRISIDVESDAAFMEDGRPFIHREFTNLSSDDRSKLVRLRQFLLGRPLNEDEKRSFDPSTEMLQRRVQYVIEHTYRDGKTFANIASWSLLKEDGATPRASAGATGTPEEVRPLTEEDMAF